MFPQLAQQEAGHFSGVPMKLEWPQAFPASIGRSLRELRACLCTDSRCGLQFWVLNWSACEFCLPKVVSWFGSSIGGGLYYVYVLVPAKRLAMSHLVFFRLSWCKKSKMRHALIGHLTTQRVSTSCITSHQWWRPALVQWSACSAR